VLLARLDDLYRSKSSIVRVEIDVTTPRSTRWFGHRRAIRDVDTQRQMVGSVERHLPFGAEPVGLMLHSQSVRRIAAGRIRADPRGLVRKSPHIKARRCGSRGLLSGNHSADRRYERCFRRSVEVPDEHREMGSVPGD
jgi:hypothetical protein